jgi:hypothetical protein
VGQYEKDPSGGGAAGVLTKLRAPRSWGAKKASSSNDFDPGAFPKLNKVAHFEMTVDKSNNSTSGFPVAKRGRPMLARAMFDVGYFPPNTPPDN